MMTTRRTALKGICAIPVAVASAIRLAGAVMLPGSNASSAVGQTFDFYIATVANGGNDANLGTLSSPWAITSLMRHSETAQNVSNNAKMSGKRVGVLPGTYGIYSYWSSGAYSYNDPVLSPPSGSSSAWSFVGASDINGHQTIGGVFITASPSGTPGGGLPGAYTDSIAMAGSFEPASGGGYVWWDGITFSDSTNLIISFYGPASSQGGPPFKATNCTVYNVGGSEGNNTGAVWLKYASNCLIQNCLIHDVNITGGTMGHNCAGIFSENCSSNIYDHCTIYNANSGIYDKDQPNGGHTYRYNYIEVNGSNPFNCLTGPAGGAAGQVLTVHHNVLVLAGSTSVERNILLGICDDNPPGNNPYSSLVFYSNTIYVLSGAGFQGGITWQSLGTGESPTAAATIYNNIIISALPGYVGTLNLSGDPGGIALSDYNAFAGGCGAGNSFGVGTNGSPTTTYSLSTWQSLRSLDTHSIAPTIVQVALRNPGVAQTPSGYQLGAGSHCINAGSTNGTSGGAACDMGAFGYDPATGIPNPQVGAPQAWQ